MKFIVELALALAAQDKPPQDPPKPPAFVYDAWQAWSSFGPGAVVEHKTENPSGVATITRTIKEKTDTMVTIEVIRRVKMGNDNSTTTDTEYVKRPEKDAKPEEKSCGMCKKVHPKDVSQSAMKTKVGNVELDCTVLEQTVVDCDGKKIGRLARWYSTLVPGWLVRMDSAVDETVTSTKCTMFSKP